MSSIGADSKEEVLRIPWKRIVEYRESMSYGGAHRVQIEFDVTFDADLLKELRRFRMGTKSMPAPMKVAEKK